MHAITAMEASFPHTTSGFNHQITLF